MSKRGATGDDGLFMGASRKKNVLFVKKVYKGVKCFANKLTCQPTGRIQENNKH